MNMSYVAGLLIRLSEMQNNYSRLSLPEKLEALHLEKQLEKKEILLKFNQELNMFEIACYICRGEHGASVVYILQDYHSFCFECWHYIQPLWEHLFEKKRVDEI